MRDRPVLMWHSTTMSRGSGRTPAIAWRNTRDGLQLDLDLHIDAAAIRREVAGRRPAPQPDLSEITRMVTEFHSSFGLPMSVRPTTQVTSDLVQLRIDLLTEEVGEFAEASDAGDVVEIADALADIVYVAFGAAITYGIDLDAVLREVHRSNMSKLDEFGRPVMRADGKVLKSHRYREPDVAGTLLDQPPLPF